jgi:hypothetical protein
MSKATDRKFRKEREAHYALEREKDAERAQARLKGFKPATMSDMTSMILGTPQVTSTAGVSRQQRRHNRARRGR